MDQTSGPRLLTRQLTIDYHGKYLVQSQTYICMLVSQRGSWKNYVHMAYGESPFFPQGKLLQSAHQS